MPLNHNPLILKSSSPKTSIPYKTTHEILKTYARPTIALKP